MSWPLASFAIVALVLGAGWLAYERARPSPRLAAIVAVLAALAALGRDAFVALPDVKPITAMTLAVGYALGPLPGFSVGALGMLVSNFVLGQGPYTPWQMAAWGLVGLAGAALGRLTGRRLGRVALACACAGAALAAKEVMNVYTWTIGASHSPAALLAVAGQALAFDITDVVASFLFGLAFAPELVSILSRLRLRMEVSWEETAATAPVASRSAVGALVALVLVAGSLALATAPRSARASTARAHTAARVSLVPELAYLTSAENSDGGFGAARGQASSELYSAWAAMALAAAGRDPLSVRRSGHTVLDALRGEASTLSGAGDLERTILALHACRASVHSLPGGDPVARLLGYRSRDGSFAHQANLTAFAILALRAAGRPASDRTILAAARWLAAQQEHDGGFGFATRGGGSDVDDTAAVVQALAVAAAAEQRSLARSRAYLLNAQNPDGGFPQQAGSQSNAQSTAWAIQGLVASGRNPATVTRAGSRSPLAYLQTLVAPDGSVRYSRTGSQTPVWVTSQALTALAQKPLPVAPVSRRSPPAHAAAPLAHAAAPLAQRAAASGTSVAGSRRAPNPRTVSTSDAPLAGAIGTLLMRLVTPVVRALSTQL